MTNGPYPNHLAGFMRAKRLTDPALASKLDISKQQIFNLRRWHRKLTVEWAKRLAPHLDVSWERLIIGPPSPEDQGRAEWNAFYDDLTDEQRQALRIVARGMVRRNDPPESEPPTPPPSPRPKGPDPPHPITGGRVTENRVSRAALLARGPCDLPWEAEQR